MILRTDKVGFIDKHLDYDTSVSIQAAFLKQNDFDGMIEDIKSREPIDPNKPTLEHYERFIEMELAGIRPEETWSLRKIERVYKALVRIQAARNHRASTRQLVLTLMQAGAEQSAITNLQRNAIKEEYVIMFGGYNNQESEEDAMQSELKYDNEISRIANSDDDDDDVSVGF